MTQIEVSVTEPIVQITPGPAGDTVQVAVQLNENSVTITPDVTENAYTITVTPAPDIQLTAEVQETTVQVAVSMEVTNVTIEVTETPAPGAPGSYTLRWIDFATGFSTTPTLEATIGTGDVWKYMYGTDIRYRFIATDGSEDAFYTTFSAGAVSGLLASKQIDL